MPCRVIVRYPASPAWAIVSKRSFNSVALSGIHILFRIMNRLFSCRLRWLGASLTFEGCTCTNVCLFGQKNSDDSTGNATPLNGSCLTTRALRQAFFYVGIRASSSSWCPTKCSTSHQRVQFDMWTHWSRGLTVRLLKTCVYRNQVSWPLDWKRTRGFDDQ